MNVLQTFGLSKRYGRIQAVRDLDLGVPQGSVYGVLGPNGSGKTTTLAMVLGAVHPTSGAFTWFGGAPGRAVRGRVGALLEVPSFYPSLSGEKNLAIVARIKGCGMDRVAAVLDQTGLSDRRRSLVHTYSLGMRQRLAIAAALLARPDVLVLDEPANGLDPEGIAELRELIRGMAALGTTIVMASHVLDEVDKVCSHVAVMKDGGLLASGEIGALLARGGHAGLEELFLSLVRHDAPAA